MTGTRTTGSGHRSSFHTLDQSSLVAKVRSLTPGQTMAMVDLIERRWEDAQVEEMKREKYEYDAMMDAAYEAMQEEAGDDWDPGDDWEPDYEGP